MVPLNRTESSSKVVIIGIQLRKNFEKDGTLDDSFYSLNSDESRQSMRTMTAYPSSPGSFRNVFVFLGALVVFGFFFAMSQYDIRHTEEIPSIGKLTGTQEELITARVKLEVQNALVNHVIGAAGDSTSSKQDLYAITELPDSKRLRILVTGGAGFVGSHLVDRLMMAGHEVIVVDNFFTGRKKNVMHWVGHSNFQLISHDVVEPIMLEVDQIYHLACPASPPHYQYNPIKTIKTSTMGTINMLGLAKRVQARVLLTSTSEVYGDPEVHPQPESYWGNVNPIGPRACYDEGKRVAETMMYAYKQQDGVDVRVAR